MTSEVREAAGRLRRLSIYGGQEMPLRVYGPKWGAPFERDKNELVRAYLAEHDAKGWIPPWESELPPLDSGDVVHDPYEVFGAFERWAKERYPWMDSLDIYQVADLYGLCCELACHSETFGRSWPEQQPSGEKQA